MLLLALAGFTLLFSGIGFHFWAQMSLTAGGLACAALVLSEKIRTDLTRAGRRNPGLRTPWLRGILYGTGSAIILYGIFYAGNLLARNWFGFADSNIASVYALKSGVPDWVIGLLIACIIGPSEEIFWRGYVQLRMSEQAAGSGWILAALAYAGAHLASANMMLILAALVCGLFWGWLYHRFQSLPINMISHVVWDILVFLVLPLE